MCVFLIFYLPSILFGLPTGYIIVISLLRNMSPICSPNDIVWNTLSFTIPLGLGVFGTGLAIWYGYAAKIRDFLKVVPTETEYVSKAINDASKY
jgi:hypothetical protein